MKKTFLATFILGIASFIAPALASAQTAVPSKPIYTGGVGPAVSGSAPVKMVPINAIRFVVENYPAAGITSMDKEYATGDFEINLTDGTELEFNSQGNLVEIDAPEDSEIAESVVKAVLPAQAYNQLAADDLASHIESIKVTKDGYKIEMNVPEDVEYFFTIEGIIVDPA